MTSDDYVRQVLTKYQVSTGPYSQAVQTFNALTPMIKEWASTQLVEVKPSGSYAKGTAIRGKTDVDMFISLAPNTTQTLKELYNMLLKRVREKGYNPRAQNVSIGITHNGINVDLVPAKKHQGYTSDHSLYRRKADTWTQTNVDTHIKLVSQSGRTEEIRAIKIWRQLHNIEFTSFYLELTVIEALKGRYTGQPAANVLAVLDYLSNGLVNRVIDPANSNNVISEDLTISEKISVRSQAKTSRAKQSWGEIIW